MTVPPKGQAMKLIEDVVVGNIVPGEGHGWIKVQRIEKTRSAIFLIGTDIDTHEQRETWDVPGARVVMGAPR